AKKEWGLSPKAKVRVLHTVQLDVTPGIGMAEQRDKSLNSLVSAASLHIFKTKEGGSLAKSFSVVEEKYNLPDLIASCLKSSKNDHKFLVTSQNMLLDTWFAIVASLTSHFLQEDSYLDITSDHKHGSAEQDGHPIVSLCSFDSLRIVTYPVVASSFGKSSPQPVAAISSIGVVFVDASYLT
nr:hypothetical protein [Tanacetum cinerariifolium]